MTATQARREAAPPAETTPEAEDEARACAYSVLAALLRGAPDATLLDQISALDLTSGTAGPPNAASTPGPARP